MGDLKACSFERISLSSRGHESVRRRQRCLTVTEVYGVQTFKLNLVEILEICLRAGMSLFMLPGFRIDKEMNIAREYHV